MIKDRIENIGLYEGLSQNLGNAIRFAQSEGFMEQLSATGRIDGEGFYVMLQEYATRSDAEGKWETHKKYIDIQYVVCGEERTGYSNIANLGSVQEGDSERDFYFYNDTDIVDWLLVHSGEFVIFFPTDGHKPSLHVNNKIGNVKKVVFKVEV